MSVGPDMAYGSGELRDGGALAAGVGDVARTAEQALGRAEVVAAMLGDVTGAPELAAGLGRAREAHTATCRSVTVAHTDLDARAQQVATTGDGLVVDTTAIAGGGPP